MRGKAPHAKGLINHDELYNKKYSTGKLKYNTNQSKSVARECWPANHARRGIIRRGL